MRSSASEPATLPGSIATDHLHLEEDPFFFVSFSFFFSSSSSSSVSTSIAFPSASPE